MPRIFLLLTILLCMPSCSPDNGFRHDKERILKEYQLGNFHNASALISSAFKKGGVTRADSSWLIIHQANMDRIRLDFSKTEQDIREQLNKYFPTLTDSLLRNWESANKLEMRLIDADKRYFKYAVSNLFRLDTAAASTRQRIAGMPEADPLDSICLANTSHIIAGSNAGIPVETHRITFGYTLTVDADAVPAGEIIRCWLPFPAKIPPRQNNIILTSAYPERMIPGDPKSVHSSLYAEQLAVAGKPTVFSYEAEFEISAQWFDPDGLSATSSGNFPDSVKEFLKEEPPHVVFSPLVKQLADSLTIAGNMPFEQIRSYYRWIDENIPWASALEYSTFDCIPDYVLTKRHGDCGMVTFLLLSMARYKGIPARWQSGWMLHPGEENLHDWCEIWYQDIGWVPVDMSFGLQNSNNILLREFYLSGIDSYRMIVNTGFAGELDPPKKHYRSEPFDFQRGEVESPTSNIYFNQWDYHLNVHSIQKINR